MDTRTTVGKWALGVALLVCFLELGGSLYEYVVVDRVWPRNLELIRPSAGGVDRKQFWMPLHLLLTLALPIGLFCVWKLPAVRFWALTLLGLYVLIRGWTFAYFVPKALAFEAGTLSSPDAAAAWTRWSILRAPLLMGATYAAYRAWSLLAHRDAATSGATAAE